MATRRFSHLDDFVLKDGKIGIGTVDPSASLEVVGTLKAVNIKATDSGITTSISLEGVLHQNMQYPDSVSINSGDSGTLSGEVVIGTGTTLSVGTGATTGQGIIESFKVSNTFNPPTGGTDERPSAPQPGALFYNKDFRTIEYWDGNFWRQVDNIITSGRGLVIGGYTPSPSIVYKDVQTFNFSTKGNTTSFGQSAMSAPYETAGFGSKIRAYNATDGSYTKQIDYYTLASQSNGIDFGELTGTYGYGSALSSQTRGVISAGYGHPSPGANLNTIDYIQMTTTGEGKDFGDHTNVGNVRAALSDGVRGVWAGNGGSPSPSAEVQLNIIASKGDSVTYGDLSYVGGNKGASNSTRGIINNINGNESYQLDSGGNSIVFGDLTTAAHQSNVCASQTRVVIAGGHTPSWVNTISYVTIATLGNAEDFGDLSGDNASGAACSDSHGGLGGY